MAADPRQVGSVSLAISSVLAALLAGGGITLYLQLVSTRQAGITRSSLSSRYCAEAGIAEAEPLLLTAYASWDLLLDGDPDNDPSWYPVRGDRDGDGELDYEVRLVDNDDEVPPAPTDPTVNADQRVVLVGRCLEDPEIPATVETLIEVSGFTPDGGPTESTRLMWTSE